jgi:hypothetical protein
MTEFLQHLDYDLVASFKIGKRRLKYYVISRCARHLYVGTRRSQPTVSVRVAWRWGGLDSVWEQEKLEVRKMLENAARREAAVPSVQCTLCWLALWK